MIIEETFYAVKCDVCGRTAENEDEHSFWGQKSDAQDNAKEWEWHEEGDYHYCPECHDFDDDDNLIVKEKK